MDARVTVTNVQGVITTSTESPVVHLATPQCTAQRHLTEEEGRGEVFWGSGDVHLYSRAIVQV